MQQDNTLINHPSHYGLCFSFCGSVPIKQERFGELDIPVADFAPDEGIKRIGRIIETIGFKCRIDSFAHLGGLTDDPFVHSRAGLWHGPVRANSLVHFRKACCVPELGCEVAIAGDLLF